MHSLKLLCLAAMAACAVACAVQHRPTLTAAQREDIFIGELKRSGEPMWSPLLLSVRRADIIQSAQGACASGLSRDEMIQRSTGQGDAGDGRPWSKGGATSFIDAAIAAYCPERR
jgi:Protein of unknown function (DUF732)